MQSNLFYGNVFSLLLNTVPDGDPTLHTDRTSTGVKTSLMFEHLQSFVDNVRRSLVGILSEYKVVDLELIDK